MSPRAAWRLERLGYGPVYDYAVNITSNPQRIPGKVAGIFLHVTDGNPTWGCVAIGRDEMKSILNWLDPAANPQITIGVLVNNQHIIA